jgi:hypothetical protein
MTPEATPTEYPRWTRPRRITDGITVGVHKDGPLYVKAPAGCFTYLFGKHGSGRTTLLRNIVIGATACTDVVTWVIDLHAGTFAQPFLSHFADGAAPDPVIDWVATTVNEVKTMLATALELGRERQKRLAGAGAVEPGNTDQNPPFVFIAVASGLAELVADPDIADLLAAVAMVGEDTNIGGVLTGYEMTSEYVPPALLPYIGTRIAVGRTDRDDLERAFGPLEGIEPPRRTGEALAGMPGDEIHQFRAWLSHSWHPNQLEKLHAARRPQLEPTAVVDGVAYSQRWLRTGNKVIGEDCKPHVLLYGGVEFTSLDGLTPATLARHLRRSPSVNGPAGYGAVHLLTEAADQTILTDKKVREAFTVSDGHIFIDWAMLAKLGRELTHDRTYCRLRAAHPDFGPSLLLAAGLATGLITNNGIAVMCTALVYAEGE